jgi:hypothetical protein
MYTAELTNPRNNVVILLPYHDTTREALFAAWTFQNEHSTAFSLKIKVSK